MRRISAAKICTENMEMPEICQYAFGRVFNDKIIKTCLFSMTLVQVHSLLTWLSYRLGHALDSRNEYYHKMDPITYYELS